LVLMILMRVMLLQEIIARRSDIFVMSSDGAIGAYVNLHGYVHETLTLSCARGMRIEGPPQTENSWFPGYVHFLKMSAVLCAW
jgi:cereblon